jgi:hypothetical protein
MHAVAWKPEAAASSASARAVDVGDVDVHRVDRGLPVARACRRTVERAYRAASR